MKNSIKNRHEVLLASLKWINAFNKGDLEFCANAYHHDSILNAKPITHCTGKENIKKFWQNFVSSTQATDLVYYNVQLQDIDEHTIHLSANWYMNVGRGIITLEKWVKQNNDLWLLEQDDFEVQEQY